MTESWKVTLPCSRSDAEMFSDELPQLAAIQPAPVLVTSELAEFSDDWILEAFFESEPDKPVVAILASLIPGTKVSDARIEKLADEDWVTISQQGLRPIHVGRFFVHTMDTAEQPDGTHAFRIEASQAFGTGHHETTEGCLAMLDNMEHRGQYFRHIADIGTGTGLLAFAAMHLWPNARCVASDIDPVAIDVARRFAGDNAVPIGRKMGQIALVTACGTDHPLIRQRAPYDLLIANILAGPLTELAPSFAASMANGGTLVLAGLLDNQAANVIAAYAREGLRLVEQSENGEWPILRLEKRKRYGWRRPKRANGRTSQKPGDTGEW